MAVLATPLAPLALTCPSHQEHTHTEHDNNREKQASLWPRPELLARISAINAMVIEYVMSTWEAAIACRIAQPTLTGPKCSQGCG